MNRLIHEIYEIHSLQEQMKQAEKSRVAILASEAQAIYSVDHLLFALPPFPE